MVEQRRRYNDENAMPPSCLACQESWMKHQGVVLDTLDRLEKMGDENQKILSSIPVIAIRQENVLVRLTDAEKDIKNIKLDQAKQRGIMTVIGTGAGLVAGGFIDFLLGKVSGRH